MTRRDWYLNLSLIFVIWAIDYITKMLAVKFVSGMHFYGPVGLTLHFNPGAMMGTFSHLPPVLRVVSLSTGGAFLCCIYLALQHLISIHSPSLRYGMSILLGGILGNVTDRILQGAVTDFIMIGAPGASTPVFNFADAIQWVGYALVIYSLIKDGHLFWPEENSRKSLWVNPNFQMKYVGTFLVMGLGFTLISGVFFYTYLKITIDALVVESVALVEQRFLVPFFITFSVIAVGFLLMLLVVSRRLSHRTAGPLYAFEKFLEDILNGKDRDLKLRAGDEFMHLEELSERLKLTLKRNNANTTGVLPAADSIVTEK